MIFAEDPVIKAVKLKQSASRYVNERGRRNAFIVKEIEHGYESIDSIDRTDKGVILVLEKGFDRMSKAVEVMDNDIEAIFYKDIPDG